MACRTANVHPRQRIDMSVTSFEAVVQDGQIRLPDTVKIPDQTKVYVVVPELQDRAPLHIYSPRLAHPEQAVDFVKVVSKEDRDAGVR
jgi:hypothetical protein